MGNTLYEEHHDPLEQFGRISEKVPGAAEDESTYHPKFAVTSEGEPLGISEYADYIASAGTSTNVISFIDF